MGYSDSWFLSSSIFLRSFGLIASFRIQSSPFSSRTLQLDLLFFINRSFSASLLSWILRFLIFWSFSTSRTIRVDSRSPQCCPLRPQLRSPSAIFVSKKNNHPLRSSSKEFSRPTNGNPRQYHLRADDSCPLKISRRCPARKTDRDQHPPAVVVCGVKIRSLFLSNAYWLLTANPCSLYARI